MEDPSKHLVHIEFLECNPGKLYYKYFKWNTLFKIVSIKRVNFAPSDCSFIVEEDKTHENTVCIIYKPLIANATNHDYYCITSSAEETKILSLYGKTIEVDVQCDTSLICFNCINSNPMYKTINLINSSVLDTHFQFMNDSEHSGLSIKPFKGIIKQKETVKVVLTYQPKHPGFTFRKIFCVVRWQEPIIIEIRTKFKRTSVSKTFRDFIYTNEVLPKYYNGFEEYVEDVSMELYSKKKPLFTICRKYIDFGFKDLLNHKPAPFETFTVNNNTLIDCVITWEIGHSKEFKIEPMTCPIKSNSQQVFYATFEPRILDNMYKAEILANINWGDQSEFLIPYSFSVNFLGHTLTNLRSGWDPYYGIEHKRVVLPATVPNYPTAGTFLLVNTSEHPLMFRFFPPYKSNFDVKPEQGIIEDGFQLIVFWYVADSVVQNVSEDWELQLNAHLKVKIQLNATAEYPFLQISEDDVIKFPPTSIHCETSQSIRIINKTRLHIKYSMSSEDHSFYTENDENIIGPLEQCYTKMFFKPKTLGNMLVSMFCEMSLIKPKIPNINSKSIVVLEGCSTRISLMTQPRSLSLNGLLNTSARGSFILSNESECMAYIGLHAFNSDGSCCSFPCDIQPNFISLKPNTSLQVEIDLCPNFDDIEKIKIGYILYTNDKFSERVENMEDYEYLPIQIEIISGKPILHIKDIHLNNTGQNLTKLHCWKMLNIDLINAAFQNMMTSVEISPINIKLPTFEEESDPFFIELLIENKSKFGVELSIEYEKICPCSCELIDEGLTLRRLLATCGHDKQIYFELKKKKFLPYERGIVEIHCNYNASDRDLFKFVATVTATEKPTLRGSVDLYIERHCSQKLTALVDFFHSSLNNSVKATLTPVFVGDPCKPIQIIWTYNNSLKEVSYTIQVHPKYRGMIFNFLNKTGCIAPITMHPLFIKFNPVQFKKYSIVAEFITETRKLELEIRGEGRSQPCYETYSMPHFLPLVSHFENDKSVHLSVDHIILKPMLLHSIKKRLVVLKNNTSDRMKFFWTSRQFGALLNIGVLPATGVIPPHQSTICQIIIHALSSPCRFNAYVSCKIINLTKEEMYSKSVEAFKTSARLFDTEFHYDGKNYRAITIPSAMKSQIIQTLNLNIHEYNILTSFINSTSREHMNGTNNSPKVEVLPKPKPEYINLTMSVHTLSERNLDMVMPDINDQIKSLNQNKIVPYKKCSNLVLSRKEAELSIDVISRIVWEVLHKKHFKENISKPPKDFYYRDILKCQEKKPMRIPPNHIILNVINGITCNLMAEMFNIKPTWGRDIFMKQSRSSGPKKTYQRRYSNEYYQEILKKGPYCMMTTYSSENHQIIERRRSDVQRRPTKITFYEENPEEEADYPSNLRSSI